MRYWHCHVNGQTYGPYPEEQMVDMFEARRISEETLVYCSEQADRGWVNLGETEIVYKLNTIKELQKVQMMM